VVEIGFGFQPDQPGRAYEGSKPFTAGPAGQTGKT
jgi:hypothetical protein